MRGTFYFLGFGRERSRSFPAVSVFGGWGRPGRYKKLRNDFLAWARCDKDPGARFTTLMDLYGLPHDFPGMDAAAAVNDSFTRAGVLEQALREDLGDVRLLPYIQVHEFEALLFSELSPFPALFPDSPKVRQKLEDIRAAFPTPEHIDDSPHSAPSKRIQQLLPDYRKPAFGAQLAALVGLERMLAECPRFAAWVARLQQPGCGI